MRVLGSAPHMFMTLAQSCMYNAMDGNVDEGGVAAFVRRIQLQDHCVDNKKFHHTPEKG